MQHEISKLTVPFQNAISALWKEILNLPDTVSHVNDSELLALTQSFQGEIGQPITVNNVQMVQVWAGFDKAAYCTVSYSTVT